MSTKPRAVNLREHEVRALLDNGRVLLVRLLKRQPLPPVAHYERDGERWVAKGATVDVERQFSTTWPAPIRCPFGAPGQALYGRETYYYDAILDGRADGCFPETEAELDRDNLYYLADGTCCEQIPECMCAEYEGGTPWRSPVTMPRWAVRPEFQLLVVRGVEVVPLSKLTERQAELAGCASLWEMYLHAGQGGNPWLWCVEIERVNEEEANS